MLALRQVLRHMNMHQARVHGQRCQLRSFVPTAACPVCHKWYHQRLRAVYHLKHTPACREVVESGALPQLGDEELAALDAADLAHRRECRRLGIHARGGPPCCNAAPHEAVLELAGGPVLAAPPALWPVGVPRVLPVQGHGPAEGGHSVGESQVASAAHSPPCAEGRHSVNGAQSARAAPGHGRPKGRNSGGDTGEALQVHGPGRPEGGHSGGDMPGALGVHGLGRPAQSATHTVFFRMPGKALKFAYARVRQTCADVSH